MLFTTCPGSETFKQCFAILLQTFLDLINLDSQTRSTSIYCNPRLCTTLFSNKGNLVRTKPKYLKTSPLHCLLANQLLLPVPTVGGTGRPGAGAESPTQHMGLRVASSIGYDLRIDAPDLDHLGTRWRSAREALPLKQALLLARRNCSAFLFSSCFPLLYATSSSS